MKRTTFAISAATLALLFAVAAGFVWWLFATPQGAWKILSMSADAAGVNLKVGQLKGSFSHGLELREITLRSPHLEARAGFFHLDFRPMLLITGNVVADSIRISGVTIKDLRPEKAKPPELTWPVLPAWTSRIQGWVNSITIRDMSYQRLERDPVLINSISTRLDWREGHAILGNLLVDSPKGRVAGNGHASFREQRLGISMTIAPAGALAGFSAFLVDADLKPARGTEQSSGVVRLGALSARKRWAELSAGLGVTRSSLQLRNIVLTEPGRKGKLTGKGSISFEKANPAVSIELKAENVDLSTELPALPPVSGTFSLAGTLESYQGFFSLATDSKDWRSVRLSGSITGNGKGADIALSRGAVMGGTLTGSVSAGWEAGISLSAAVHGRNLNPARITRDWNGLVNLELTGKLRRTGTSTVATLDASFPRSRLRGRALDGKLSASLRDGNVTIHRAILDGKGFRIRASGDLARKIDFYAYVSDLSGLVPGAGGMLRATGDLQRRKGLLGFTATGLAEKLRIGRFGAQAVSFSSYLGATPTRQFNVRATARGFSAGSFQAATAFLEASGTAARHAVRLVLGSTTASLEAQLEGSFKASVWQGRLARLAGRDSIGPWNLQQPADIRISRTGLALSPFILDGNPGERFQIRGAANRQFSSGYAEASWQKLNLARIGQWLSGVRITGSGTGRLSLLAPQKGAISASGDMEISGSLSAGKYQVDVRSGQVTLETRGRKLEGTITLDTVRQGRLKTRFESLPPSGGLIPRNGELDAQLEGLDMKLLNPWLPGGLALEGTLTARTAGEWGPGGAVRLAGRASVAGGLVRQQRKGGELTATLRTAALSWDWSGSTLSGEAAFELSDTGHLAGSFALPLPARFPAAMDPAGRVAVNITGTMRENGLMAALFPGMVQESRGELDIDLRVGNTWGDPAFSGQALFSRAGMYLPRAGIRLTDLQASASLERDGIRISSFSASSGTGTINGSGFIRLADWKTAGYHASLKGDRFQLMNLPELQVVGSPMLDIQGEGKKLTVRGEMGIPELLVAGRQTQSAVRPSADVIVIDAPPKEVRAFPLALDMQVRVLFGERVYVKTEGIDARLSGAVDLVMRGPDDIRGKGEIRVAEGSYRAYGVNLKIVKGRLVYTGGAVDRPNLDIMALRTVGEVKAGVIIGGNLKRPAIRLYSEPALSDTDIMGYIVLGHPLTGDKGQIGDVMQAAGLLLSAGQSTVLQEQIGQRFGLDSIGVETDKKDTSSSIVTVGKYLTPKLFISYGRSLFSPTTYLKARYTFSDRWELETWTGTESGADLYYKINFD